VPSAQIMLKKMMKLQPDGKKPNKQVLKPKHIPGRSCIACRTVRNKKELIRLVCDNNEVGIDIDGKKPGRGAYLCPAYECWEITLKGNRLDYSLKTKVSFANRQMLLQYGSNLPKRNESKK
jgi:predicted RNA-binding protein YlxR (DUF448 family)